MIQLSKVFAGYGQAPILQDITLTISAGSVTTLIGPNGCGKTTLLRVIAGQLPYTEGSVSLFGKDVSQYDRKALARKVAMLPQSRDIPSLAVEALVRHGRYPHLGFSRRLTKADEAIVAKAMEQADVADLAPRELKTLSGGQRQRAYLAMALAQDTDVILLDEPATHLDLNRQFELLELIRSLKDAGKTILLVLHDLDHALRYSDRLILLQEGRLVQTGTPRELLGSGHLEQVFGIGIRECADGFLFTYQKKNSL